MKKDIPFKICLVFGFGVGWMIGRFILQVLRIL